MKYSVAYRFAIIARTMPAINKITMTPAPASIQILGFFFFRWFAFADFTASRLLLALSSGWPRGFTRGDFGCTFPC